MPGVVGETGIEPVWAFGPGDFKSPASPPQAFDNSQLTQTAPAPSAPFQRAGQDTAPAADLPPDLAQVAAAWQHLPEAVKAGILAMVSAASRR